jgi:hypothetical protein
VCETTAALPIMEEFRTSFLQILYICRDEIHSIDRLKTSLSLLPMMAVFPFASERCYCLQVEALTKNNNFMTIRLAETAKQEILYHDGFEDRAGNERKLRDYWSNM